MAKDQDVTTETSAIHVSAKGAHAIREIARAHGMSAREYLEALMHYAISCERRPGSWEGATPFELYTYTRPDSVADRWF